MCSAPSSTPCTSTRSSSFTARDHLTDAEQAGFARLFGDLTTAHPSVPGAEAEPHVLELDAQAGGGKANAWHTDVTFVDRVPAVSILRAVTLPPYGGDTCWANTATAYQSLSPERRTLAESLHALHTNAYDYATQSGGGVGGKSAKDERHFREVFLSTVFQTEHPVVRVHPRRGSGRCCWASSSRRSWASPAPTRAACSSCSSGT
jgi:alpha-ketoglutarate-dependent taurine dioxygenase